MRKKFEFQYKDKSIHGDLMSDTDSCELICLHGAGTSDRFRFDRLRERLYEKGLSSCAFDFPGHGETGGDLKASSLLERTEVAEAVIRRFGSEESLTIIGASMSGYTAVKLLESFPVKQLVLIVPAAYDKEAYAIAFNAGFTECIRREHSYLHSDAWGILKAYTESVLIVAAELDQVIPDEVIDLYKEAAPQAELEHFIVEGAPHKVMGYMNDEAIDEIADRIVG